MIKDLHEELAKEQLAKAKKDAAYYKWLNNNQHASNRQKRHAKEQYTFCNTFSRSDIPKSKK